MAHCLAFNARDLAWYQGVAILVNKRADLLGQTIGLVKGTQSGRQ